MKPRFPVGAGWMMCGEGTPCVVRRPRPEQLHPVSFFSFFFLDLTPIGRKGRPYSETLLLS